jgi:hypothetical protein
MKYAAFLALLPSFIQFAEDIHGPKKSEAKLSTVVTMAQNALLVAGSAGLVSPGMAQNLVNITDSVEKALTTMKTNNTLVQTGPNSVHNG